jgi:hypothetical protein
MMNGVDVADVTRSFSEDDWHKLGDAGRRYVNAERTRTVEAVTMIIAMSRT